MKRPVLALLFALALSIAGRPASADVVLRPNVLIDGDIVKLGDLFDNAGDKAGVAVARAPAPGRRVTVDAQWLARIAQGAGLAWRPRDAFEQAVIERNGVTIDHERVEAEIRTALANQGVPANAEIELANRAFQMVVPVNASLEVGIRDLYYDQQTKRFTATVEAPAGSPSAARARVAGRVCQMIDVPVLARPIGRGEAIGPHDIAWSKMREDQVRRDILTNPQEMIGLTPRQTLRNGQAVSASDLEKLLAVTRGALVTMVVKEGPMTLTAQGRAIEQGSLGDIIRLTNIQSNLTVQGRIEGPNLVRVTPNGGIALAN